jgi:hypothetical protein
LEGGPSGFRPGFTCPILLGYSLGRVSSFAYGAITLCGFLSSVIRLDLTLLTAAGVQIRRSRAPQPPVHNAPGLTCTRFGLCPLRSPLLGTSRFLSLPGVTKMFQFAPFASAGYSFAGRIMRYGRMAFPHSEISGSKVASTSPELIAAGHVLHRLSAPRHPPHTLSSLTTESVPRGTAPRGRPVIPVRIQPRRRNVDDQETHTQDLRLSRSALRAPHGELRAFVLWCPYGTLFNCQRSSRREAPPATPEAAHDPRGRAATATPERREKRDGPGRWGKRPLRRPAVPHGSKSSRP